MVIPKSAIQSQRLKANKWFLQQQRWPSGLKKWRSWWEVQLALQTEGTAQCTGGWEIIHGKGNTKGGIKTNCREETRDEHWDETVERKCAISHSYSFFLKITESCKSMYSKKMRDQICTLKAVWKMNWKRNTRGTEISWEVTAVTHAKTDGLSELSWKTGN